MKKIFWKIEKIVKKGEYLYAVVRNHPKANEHGYVLAHRVVVENKLGRMLRDDEVVHHINGNKHDNDEKNLMVESKSAHASRHGKLQGKNYVILKCPYCKTEFEKPRNHTHFSRKGKFTSCGRKCNGSFCREIQMNGYTKEIKNAISENVIKEYTKTPS